MFVAGLLAASCGALAQNIERVRLTDNDLNCGQMYAEVQQMEQLMRMPPQGQPQPMPVAVVAMPQQVAAPPPSQPQAESQIPSQLGGLFGALAGAAAGRAGGNVGGAAQLFGGFAGGAAPQIAGPAVSGMGGMPGMPTDMQGLLNDQAAREVLLTPNMQQSIARARAAGMSDAQILSMVAPAINARRAQIASQQQAQQPQQVYNSQPVLAQPPQPGTYGAGAAYGAPAAIGGQGGRSMAQQAQARKEHLTTMFLNKGCKLADVHK